MKKLTLFLALIMIFTLSACRSAEPPVEDTADSSELIVVSTESETADVPSQEVIESSQEIVESSEDQPDSDWRDEADISKYDEMQLNGEIVKVCICTDDNGVMIFRDDPVQEMLVQADYSIIIENAAEAFTDCDFEDIDQDGTSDLTVYFTLPDGSRAMLLWFWTDRQGYVLNEELSQLPGESNW